jgi:hypothetical protein
VKPEDSHIGNVKLEPIIPRKSAAIGILIGEENWRSKGVGFEVITRVLEYCFTDLELELVELGVDKKNLKAIIFEVYINDQLTKNIPKRKGVIASPFDSLNIENKCIKNNNLKHFQNSEQTTKKQSLKKC